MEPKHKLHLRKQVIYAIPLSISLALFIFLFIVKLSSNTHVELRAFNTVTKSNTPTEYYPINFTFLDDLQIDIQKRRIDNTIGFYAERFKLDSKEAIRLARELTNDYTDEKYLRTFTITNNPNNNDVNPNQEAGIIRYIKLLNSYPDKYGYKWEDIHISDESDTERRRNTKGQIIMTNGMTFEQYVAKISNIIGVDPALSLAIIYNESGRCRSPLFVNRNNVAGMKSINGWANYTTLESGVISFVLNLKAILNNYQMDPNTDEGLLNLSAVYVNGNIGVPAMNWYENVYKIRNEVNNTDLLKY